MNTLPDRLYELLIYLESFLDQLLVSYYLWKLSVPFFRRKKACLAPPAMYFLVVMSLWLLPVNFDSLWVYVSGILAAFLAMLLLCDGSVPIKIFLCATFFSIRAQGESMVTQAHTDIFGLELQFLDWLTDGNFARMWQYNIIHIYLFAAINMALLYLVFSGMTRFILQKLPLKGRELTGREILLLLIPSISGMAHYFIVHWLYNQAGSLLGGRLFGSYPYMGGLVSLMHLATLASMLLAIALFSSLEKKKEEEKEQAALSGQMQEMRSHIREMEQLYQGIRGMKHDIKNHITAMEGLMEQGEYREAQNFLGSMEQAMERLEYAYQTGNPVTDVILNEKCSQARQAGIRFKAEFQFPLEMGIDVFDVSIILSNALENAIEAAQKCLPQGSPERQKTAPVELSPEGEPAPAELSPEGEPARVEVTPGRRPAHIEVAAKRRKQAWLLQVRNSFCGELKWNPQTGLPLSSKEDTIFHGLGLQNIRSVAEKYLGDLELEAAGGEFVLTVMLQGKNCDSHPSQIS